MEIQSFDYDLGLQVARNRVMQLATFAEMEAKNTSSRRMKAMVDAVLRRQRANNEGHTLPSDSATFPGRNDGRIICINCAKELKRSVTPDSSKEFCRCHFRFSRKSVSTIRMGHLLSFISRKTEGSSERMRNHSTLNLPAIQATTLYGLLAQSAHTAISFDVSRKENLQMK